MFVAPNQTGIDFFDLLCHKAELRNAIGIKLLFVAECYWFKCQDRLAGPVHWLDLLLKTSRGGRRAKLTNGVYFNGYTCNCCPAYAGNKGFRLGSLCANA